MLELIFPETCLACGSPIGKKERLCAECLSGITLISDLAACVACGIPFGFYKDSGGEDDGHLCGRCITEPFSFSKSRSIALYDGKLIDIIYEFKYRGKLGHGGFLSGLLVDNMPYDPGELDVIVPVPVHIKKLRSREYNQSAVLAVNLGKRIGVRHDLLGLRKIRDTRPQFEIEKEDERRRNVKGAFSVAVPGEFSGKSVLLLDDVFTTGSTSDECARALLKAGASRVGILTVARARWS